MPLEYEKITEIQCKFRGSDLKVARKAHNLTRYKLAAIILTYPTQIRRWEESDFVALDSYTMERLLAALGQEL